MKSLNHLFDHAKNYGMKHKPLYVLSIMTMFWAIFEGIISYIIPLIIVENGHSMTVMGLIIGSSSVSGAIFDFLICRYFKNTNFRRIFLIMFIMCFLLLLFILSAKTIMAFLLLTTIWGLAFDLNNVGNFDFVGRFTQKNEHSSSFGVLRVFQSLGYVFAPLLAGLVIGELVGYKPIIMAGIFLAISLIFFIILINLSKPTPTNLALENSDIKPRNTFFEIKLLFKIGKKIMPVLFLTAFLFIIDALYMEIGPLLGKSFTQFGQFEGLFVTVYCIPPLIVGWFVGKITKKHGKKNTAFYSLLFGSIILFFLSFTQNPYTVLLIIFVSTVFIDIAMPSINGCYADYISEEDSISKEIEGIEDLFTNLGYFIGPIVAGILADAFGTAQTFTIFGLFGVIIAIILIITTPKHINVNSKKILNQMS
jgi:MFS family permease